jgi:hypothetical protein
MGGIERQFDVLGGRTGDGANDTAINRRNIFERLALDRGDPLAADNAGFRRILRAESAAQTGFTGILALTESSTISAVGKMLIVAKAFKMTCLGLARTSGGSGTGALMSRWKP